MTSLRNIALLPRYDDGDMEVSNALADILSSAKVSTQGAPVDVTPPSGRQETQQAPAPQKETIQSQIPGQHHAEPPTTQQNTAPVPPSGAGDSNEELLALLSTSAATPGEFSVPQAEVEKQIAGLTFLNEETVGTLNEALGQDVAAPVVGAINAAIRAAMVDMSKFSGGLVEAYAKQNAGYFTQQNEEQQVSQLVDKHLGNEATEPQKVVTRTLVDRIRQSDPNITIADATQKAAQMVKLSMAPAPRINPGLGNNNGSQSFNTLMSYFK